MVYLNSITFPNSDAEMDFIWGIPQTCYDSYYPFKILSAHGLECLDFDPITILYGGNGSGKSTALNVTAEKLMVQRDSIFNKSNFYPYYLELCQTELAEDIPENSRIITSDDVFEYILSIRDLNEGIDRRRDGVLDEYLNAKYQKRQMRSLADYDQIKKMNNARRKTQSQFVRDELMDNIRAYSNGESAFKYFTEKMGDNGLFLLDEPENSLSPKRQTELAGFIADAARFFECQIILSTHSPFLLSLCGAKIYDMDQNPVTVRKWYELENIRLYYDFFKNNEPYFT